MIKLRTFTYIDILQPQVAAFQATISQGYLPIEGQACLYLEIAPGIEINRITDAVLKRTRVKPGIQIVERAPQAKPSSKSLTSISTTASSPKSFPAKC
jgi:hypothetical protein